MSANAPCRCPVADLADEAERALQAQDASSDNLDEAIFVDIVSATVDRASFLRAKSAKEAAFQLVALMGLVERMASLVQSVAEAEPGESPYCELQEAEKTKEEMNRLIYSVADVLESVDGKLGAAVKEYSMPADIDPFAKIEGAVVQARKEVAHA
ncbi:hypothetical protein [Methylocystis sp.]|uniref:hypothetical protein n=1 Tax=Methylocystis sp. TaxID=1911079 RepID=UPI003D0D9DD4